MSDQKTTDIEEIPEPEDVAEGTEAGVTGGNTSPEPQDDEPDTFPREYVVKLRAEAAESRIKAKRADELAHRLHTALVASSGRLADPTDLAYADEHLDSPDALTEALEALIAAKPHLASRKPRGVIGAGATKLGDSVSLAGMLRARA